MTCPHCECPIYPGDIISEETISNEEWLDDNYKALDDRKFCPHCRGEITAYIGYELTEDFDRCEVCGGEMIDGLCRFCDLGE